MNEFDFEDEPTDFDTYSFYYTDSDGNRDIEAHIQLPYDCQWTTALEHYLDFLSNIYGYDIRSQVAVKANPYRKRDWSGPTFPDEEDAPMNVNYGGSE